MLKKNSIERLRRTTDKESGFTSKFCVLFGIIINLNFCKSVHRSLENVSGEFCRLRIRENIREHSRKVLFEQRCLTLDVNCMCTIFFSVRPLEEKLDQCGRTLVIRKEDKEGRKD